MKKYDLIFISLLILILGSLFLMFYEINKFMPILETCNDDFEIVNKCGCIPCSWKDAEKLNRNLCFDVNEWNITNG